jgi:ATP-binding cassette, subfamily G (WHITE), member 2, PDR
MAAAPPPWGFGSIAPAFTEQIKSYLEDGMEAIDQTRPEVEAPSQEVSAQTVRNLARQMSRASTASRYDAEPLNPFRDDKSDPQLDPNSDEFSAQEWVKSMLAIQSRDPERYPKRTAGVSFTNLNVHGYGSPTDYQKTVGNIWLDYFGKLKRLIGVGKKLTKIQILRDFEGLVKAGEMLVVLGRPGRFVCRSIYINQCTANDVE